MKKLFWMSLLLVAIVLSVAACNGNEPEETGSEASDSTVTPAESDTQADDTPDTTPSTEAPSDTETPSDTDTPSETTPEANRPSEDVKVMSFNLSAVEATVTSRAEGLIGLILERDPDSVGLQEARGSWVAMLKRHLGRNGYTRVGVDAGGNAEATGAYFATYIYYKTDKYDLIDSGTFWLSKTPDVSSIYDSSVDCPRTCTWALLENKETGFRYVHMNTHLDWMNVEVTKIQVAMIREQIERFEAMGYPVFAGGDYNCGETTEAYREMLTSDIISNAKYVAATSDDTGTYHNNGQYTGYTIDHMFVTGKHMTVHEYDVIDTSESLLSDHSGLYVHATVNAMPVTNDSTNVPAFKDGDAATITVTGNNRAEIRFPQAAHAGGALASFYNIELVGDDDAVILSKKVTSGVLTLTPPETITYTLTDLADGAAYTLRVTPISILGDEGTPLETAFTFEAPEATVVPEEMSKADIFDLSIQSNTVSDASANQLEVVAAGAPSVSTDGITFNGSSAYKVPGIKNHYASLKDGFTLEISLTTGDNITTLQAVVANLHAGGFGFELVDGAIRFGVHVGGSYQWVYCNDVTASTTLHLIAVYDAAAGNIRLYANGKLADSLSVSGNLQTASAAAAEYLCIGGDSCAHGPDAENYFTGTIHAVRLYDTPASDGNAAWLYQQP